MTVNPVADFSSIFPSDPALAARVLAVLDGVAAGRSLTQAVSDAGVSAAEFDTLLTAARRALRARTQTTPAARKSRAQKDSLSIIANADGGSRGNPGKAACAAILYDVAGDELLRRGRLLGVMTNNAAEYESVLLAIELCRELGAARVTLRLDSELVVRQIEGRYKVKSADLAVYHKQVLALATEFEKFRVEHVPRAKNADADKLVNLTLDGKDVDGG